MRSYYYDDAPGDPRTPHDSGKPVPLEVIKSLNVGYWHVPLDDEEKWKPRVHELAVENNFKNTDFISVTREGLGASYEAYLKDFYDEHLHEDGENRYVTKGSGFYDVREHPTDKWIRMHIFPGDLIAIPQGIYHRFMLDEKNEIHGMRLWKDEFDWTPLLRTAETDTNPHHIKYLESLKNTGLVSA